MDHRVPLRSRTVLKFDGMDCHVEEVVGRGSNAIVYKGWYPDFLNPEQRHHVLIKELFPLHPEGKIRRDGSDSIIVEPEAEEHFFLHRESFLAGNEVHLRLLEEHPQIIGANLNSFSGNGTLYSVLGFSGGRTLQSALAEPGLGLRVHVGRMQNLLEALEVFHKSGYLHLDISPDNVMLVGQGEQERIFLIDYNSTCPLEHRERAVSSVKAGYSAPEVENGERDSLCFATDLYSVAAVFFRCLMGRTLSLEEMLRAKAPDGADSPCLADAPQTVSSMVARILRKGLNILPGRRYQSTGQMRLDFEELLDRVDCVGVTHWALWENGRRSVEELVRVNPSLLYVKEEGKLYPIRLRQEKSVSLEQYLASILSPEGKSGLILADGGMGKTTLLLHTALMQGKRYSPSAPAVFYVSLNGWNPGDRQYILSRLLMRMRFKREENSYESAMHALGKLLEQPLKTKKGDCPVVLLLLDGLNEVRADMGPLIREINELSKLAGVRILAASRSGVPALELVPVSLAPLEREDIAWALGERGLLLPREESLWQLLSTPLILSIYLKTGEGEKQPDIRNEEELMRAYMGALLQKELRQLAEEDPLRWQLDAALNYVLPCIAAEEKRTGGGLSEEQLLKVVEKCWLLLRSPAMRRIFPQWIGRSRAILGDRKTGEEWYDLMVHQLLWQRLGLLLRDGAGCCRVFHQRIGEYLAGVYGALAVRIRRRRRLSAAAVTAAVLGLFFLGKAGFEAHAYYPDEVVESVIDHGVTAYVSFGGQYAGLRQWTEYGLAGNTEECLSEYDTVLSSLTAKDALTMGEKRCLTQIQEHLTGQEDKAVSWSGLPLEGELARELVGYPMERSGYYGETLPIAMGWLQSGRARREYPEYLNLLSEVLEADAAVAAELYHQTCAVHLESGEKVWQDSVRVLVAGIPEQEIHRNTGYVEDRGQYLENLREALKQAQRELKQATASVKLICMEENLL